MYDNPDQTSPNLLSSTLDHGAETIEYRGHSFCVVTNRSGKDCDICHHTTFKFFTSRPSLQCTKCGARYHKQHYDDGELIQPCKGKTY
jgi:hypothetical protein